MKYLIIAATLAMVVHAACSASQVTTESEATSAIGLSANAIEPAWIGAYKADGLAAADRACTLHNDACIALRVAAVEHVRDQWSHVRDAWEAARITQGAVADALETCRTAGQPTCSVADALTANAAGEINAFRCAVRAIGHPEIDRFPGTPTCSSGSPTP